MQTNYGSASVAEEHKESLLLSKPPEDIKNVSVPIAVETNVSTKVNKIFKCSKIIIYIFLLFAVASLLMLILGFVENYTWTAFLIIILINLLLSISGSYGTYFWGTVQEQIDRFSVENHKYESNILELQSNSDKIKREVNEIQGNINKLEHEVDSLKNDLTKFDELRKNLELIAGENQTINDMIDGINNLYQDIRNQIIQNQRTKLLQKYYDVQFRDDQSGMSKGEFRRFKATLDKETRDKIENFATFEQLAGEDNVIDLNEFMDFLEKFLSQMEEELMQSEMKMDQ